MRDFDQKDNNFEDYDFDASLEQTFDQPDPTENPNSNRWAFMFLKDLPLYKHIGNNVLIDANIYDRQRTVIHNRDYFPKNNLLRLENISAPRPAEGVASYTGSNSYEAHSRPFNPDSAESGERTNVIVKTAAQCAKYFISEYGKMGGVIFNSLTGVDTYAEARKIFWTILPLNDPEIFPATTKLVLGEEFKSPFLFEILAFLQSSEPRFRLNRAEVDATEGERLKNLLSELLAGARAANNIAKGQINDTESQIAASPQRKSGYDIRDTTFKNAPEPFDLLCLAHRNQLPKDERALENARRLQENSTEPMKELAQNVNQVVNLQKDFIQSQMKGSPVVGMTAEEISKLVNSEVDKRVGKILAGADAAGKMPENSADKPADFSSVSNTAAAGAVGGEGVGDEGNSNSAAPAPKSPKKTS